MEHESNIIRLSLFDLRTAIACELPLIFHDQHYLTPIVIALRNGCFVLSSCSDSCPILRK
jgi:hypothetical protein